MSQNYFILGTATLGYLVGFPISVGATDFKVALTDNAVPQVGIISQAEARNNLVPGLASSLLAQTFPPVITPPQAPTRPLPIPERPQPTPSIEQPAPVTPPNELPPSDLTVVVREFKFVGNTVFSNEQLSAVVAPFLNRPLTFNDLIQARSAVTQFYVSRGYTTSGAFIPMSGNEAISPTAASITIQILEGRVEEIEVTGDRRLNNYVRARIARAANPIFNQNQLEEALRLLQIDPLIRNISANLSVGTQINLSRLSVAVTGNPPFSASVQLDNSRAPTIGEFQRGAQLTAESLLGLGESLSVDYRNTSGSNQINVAASIPFNTSNGTIGFSYSTLNSRIIERPFDVLNIEGNSQIYQLSVRQPLIRRATPSRVEELAIGLSATRSESSTSLDGIPFPLSPGADVEGNTRINALRFFQEYSQRNANSVLLARSQFSAGLNIFDATVSEQGPDAQFFAWRGQALWLNRVLGDARLVLRGDVQISGDQLVPLEQFSLGGSSTVRGYRQDLLLGDNGVLGSAELLIPLINEQTQRLDIVPFIDGGIVWNNGNNRTSQDNSLLSTGIGLQYQWGGLFARVNYALPLIQIDGGGDRTKNEFDFTVRYIFRF